MRAGTGVCVYGGAALLLFSAACGRATAPAPVTELAVAGRVSSTPWVAAAGRFVAVVWGASTPDGRTDVFVASSQDSGRTFGEPRQVNAAAGEAHLGGEFPPRVALSRATAAGPPEIVALWTARNDGWNTLKLARSRDAGRTFDVAVMEPPAEGNRGWASLAIDDRGKPHAIWLDHRAMSSPGVSKHEHPPSAARTKRSAEDAVAMAQKSSLYYAGGEPGAAARELTKGVCYCCKTALAPAPDGTLFAAWRHVYPGNLRDIAFTTSRDRGHSFEPVARVSADGWSIDGCPDDGPAIAVDPAGTAHVVWPTVLPGEPVQGALFYASTRDGRTFTPRVKIPALGGRKPTHPQIVADSAGRVTVAWDELVAGERLAAIRSLVIDPSGRATFGPDIRLGSGAVALYPVMAAADDAVVAVWTRGGIESSTIGVQRIVPDDRR